MQTSLNYAHTSTEDAIAIDEVLKACIDQKCSNAGEISPYYHGLWLEIARLIHSGGKRMRSKLVLLGYRAFGGKDTESILPAAAAMELLHQAMLIHDDIIDRDYIRYGVDNIAGRYNKVYDKLVKDKSNRIHYAHSAALLAGDLMLSESYILMGESSVSAEKIIAIQKLLNQSIFEVAGGELLDTEAAFRESNLILPEDVATYKTASYSFALPLLVGAELAGASAANQAYIRDFARYLGIAFQLRDDIIGVFGNESKTGKSSSNDIKEGKYTYLVKQFYKLAKPEQKNQFDILFGRRELTDAEVETVRHMLKDVGALKNTEQAIDNYEKKAKEIWNNVSADPDLQSQINELITSVTKRES